MKTDHPYLEEFTKATMIRKLVLLSLYTRRDGYIIPLRELEKDESMQWFVEAYSDNMYRSIEEMSIQEWSQPYLQAMEKKFAIVLDGVLEYFEHVLDRSKQSIPRTSTTNPNKKAMEAYSEEELYEKLRFYIDIWEHQGVLESEKAIDAELNPYIHRILEHIIWGYDMERLSDSARLDSRCLLNQYRELFEIVELGLKKIFWGENPRILERDLLCYIEEADRKSVSYFGEEVS